MKRISNYHSHVYLCKHAIGTVEEYVKEAIKWGYEEIGISDHAPIPLSFFLNDQREFCWIEQFMSMKELDNVYLKDLDYCINKYPNIKIWKGLETEYLPGHDEYFAKFYEKFDYLNLGVHYFYYNGRIIDTYKDMTNEQMEAYAWAVEEGLSKGWYNCLVHPDLYLYKVKEFSRFHEAIARKIIASCLKYDIYMEINANGKDKYPRKEFWEIVKEYPNVKIIINSDAHIVENFHGENIKRVMEFADSLGLKVQEKMIIKKHNKV